MADLLSIGLSGVRAYSTAMSTIADNIANAQTPGYAVRSTNISEMVSPTDSFLYTGQSVPSGSTVTGITRSVESWLVDNARSTSSDSGRATALSSWMTTAETSLSSPGSGIGTNITTVFNNADQLAADPSNTSLRQTFLQSVSDVGTAFQTTGKALSNTAGNIVDDATSTVNQVNSDLTSLVAVNTVLLRSKPDSAGQASLLDQRDRLLDDISSKVSITTSFGTDGTVAVSMAGISGTPLLATNILNPLSVTAQPNGSFSVSMAGSVVTPSGGYLGGLQSASTDLATRRGALDTLAVQFGSQINAQQVAGLDQNGNLGQPLFDTSGGSAETLIALAATTSQVAAADSGTMNGNMLAYAKLRGVNGAEAGWAAVVTGQSQATASANAQHASASALDNAAQSERSLQSAVNLNQEAADLLRYQQAYQASAKVLATAKETLQSILSIN